MHCFGDGIVFHTRVSKMAGKIFHMLVFHTMHAYILIQKFDPISKWSTIRSCLTCKKDQHAIKTMFDKRAG